MSAPEHWLRGPVPGVDPRLQPAAHAFLQVRDDVSQAVQGLTAAELAMSPGGAASIAFHLRHLAGSIDRLCTYSRGEALSEVQRAVLAREQTADTEPDLAALLRDLNAAIDAALSQLASTPPESVLEPREVGRARLPSNVLGLLTHAAEHAQRHTGQIIATAKIIRGLRLAERI
ncbi:MAG TPA: DinB family protein [Gemmatimonadaceae bacterium]